MIPFGEAAARSVAEELRKYSIPEEEFQARLERLRLTRDFSDAKVASIELTQSSTADARFVMRQVRTRPGDPLELQAIRHVDLERLYETGDYERIDFRLRQVDRDFELYIEAIGLQAVGRLTISVSGSMSSPISRVRARSTCWPTTR